MHAVLTKLSLFCPLVNSRLTQLHRRLDRASEYRSLLVAARVALYTGDWQR